VYSGPRPHREIRAVFDSATIRVYQAFPRGIAIPALEAQRLVPPFRLSDMTSWIKPSFLWMMARSAWGQHCRIGHRGTPEHPGETVVLGIDVQRDLFDRWLGQAVLTHDDPSGLERAKAERRQLMCQSTVIVQWDPEKALDGSRRRHRAIQIGLRGTALREYAEAAIVRIESQTGRIQTIKSVRDDDEKIALLPDERPYGVPQDVRQRLGMD